jgi:hypothetical protein
MMEKREAIARQLVRTERSADPVEDGFGIGPDLRRIEIEIDLAEVERHRRLRRGGVGRILSAVRVDAQATGLGRQGLDDVFGAQIVAGLGNRDILRLGGPHGRGKPQA